MGTSKSERLARKRKRLFDEQEGRCYYCQQPMRLLKMPAQAKYIPQDLCTFEHLDDKLSPERGKHAGEKRIVAACNRCNFQQHLLRSKEVGIEVHWGRSKRRPKEISTPEGVPFQ